jgi:DNA-binding CsgD family transcriptional regulator
MTPRISRVDESRLVTFIEQVYEAAADATRWEPFLVSLAESIKGTAAHILHHDLSSGGWVSASARHDPEVLRLYNEHFHRVDVLAVNSRARAAMVGDVMTDEMLLPRKDLKRSAYFNDFSAKHDVTRLVSVMLSKGPMVNGVVTILRRERDAPFDRQDIRLLEPVTPHLRRALQIGQRIHAATQEGIVAAEAAEALPCGVLLVDTDANVVFANQRGRSTLADRDGLSTQRGRLTAATAADTQRLRELCAAVVTTREVFPRHPGGRLRLRRPSGRLPLEVLVTPTSSNALLGVAPPTATVFVTDPAKQPRPSTVLLQQCLGLTPAESEVAAHLIAGRDLQEIADERRTAIETVRRQHKQILAKTGTRTRAELVRRLTTGISAVVREEGS